MKTLLAHSVVVTAAQAYKSLENALTWFETQDIDCVKLLQLRNLMAFAKRAELSTAKKQCKLTDFFCQAQLMLNI